MFGASFHHESTIFDYISTISSIKWFYKLLREGEIKKERAKKRERPRNM